MATDHPYTDPGDGRSECQICGKWIFPVIHSCKGVPVTQAARLRLGAQPTPPAKGQFCHEHFSWLCQAGQGACQNVTRPVR